MVALNPVDRAEAYYRLALAHRDAGQSAEARRSVLRALEEAPHFERAQELLLALQGGIDGHDGALVVRRGSSRGEAADARAQRGGGGEFVAHAQHVRRPERFLYAARLARERRRTTAASRSRASSIADTAHFSGREGPGWSHDYPRAESHFMRIIREITTIRPFVESADAFGGNILALDDPELFRYPIAYLSEPGGWFPNGQGSAGLRSYLLKGGFIIFDDFDGGSIAQDWMNFTQQMRRVFPTGRLVQLDGTHPIFDSFFRST